MRDDRRREPGAASGPRGLNRAPRRRMLAAVFGGAGGVVLAGVLALAPAVSASAHDYWVDSNPEPNSTVTQPLSTVSVTFNDVILDLTGDGASSVLEVTGPDGASTHYETGCPTVLGRTVSVPAALGAAGVYQVSWQIVSADGHPVSNAITFTYAPPAGTAPAAGSAAGPVCGNAPSTGVAALPGAASTGTGGTAGAASASGASDGELIILGVAGGIVLLAVVGVVLVLVLARRSGQSGDARAGGPDDTGSGADPDDSQTDEK